MKNLFLIDGASGTGKSDLVNYALDFRDDVELVEKYTTRSERAYENKPDWKLDLRSVDDSSFRELKLDYTYTYGGKRYGFYSRDLTTALREYPNVFVIVRNVKIIQKIQKEFDFINVVPMYVYSELESVRKRLTVQGFSSEEIDFRLTRERLAFEDYLKHPDLYKEVLINNSSIEDYHRIIDLTLRKYSEEPDIDEALVFLLMSFHPENPALLDYSEAIKRAVQNYNPNLRCINLDDVHRGAFEITPEAKSQMRKARLAIVDLTENRPNVYYELGFVHGIGKDVILTCHHETEPHFYPRGHRILFYNSAHELEMKMMKELVGVLGEME